MSRKHLFNRFFAIKQILHITNVLLKHWDTSSKNILFCQATGLVATPESNWFEWWPLRDFLTAAIYHPFSIRGEWRHQNVESLSTSRWLPALSFYYMFIVFNEALILLYGRRLLCTWLVDKKIPKNVDSLRYFLIIWENN